MPDFELMREPGILNTREIVRFDIEGLSLHLPHHKRVSFSIGQSLVRVFDNAVSGSVRSVR